MNNIWNRFYKFILPTVTVLLALLLILSYLIPNKVLDTYAMNISGEDDVEEAITLPEGSVISYTMNTGKRPLWGIQPGLSIQGYHFENAVLRYCVYKNRNNVLLSENEYSLQEISASVMTAMQTLPDDRKEQFADEPQYICLPFAEYEDCKGDIRIEFSYISNGDEPVRMQESQSEKEKAMCLMINSVQKDGSETKKDGEILKGSLTGYTVYTHNTYPLVYDLRILVFLLLAATAAAPLDRWRKGTADNQNSQKSVDVEHSGAKGEGQL